MNYEAKGEDRISTGLIVRKIIQLQTKLPVTKMLRNFSNKGQIVQRGFIETENENCTLLVALSIKLYAFYALYLHSQGLSSKLRNYVTKRNFKNPAR